MIVVLMKRNKVNALNLSYIAGLKLMIKLKINLMTQHHLSLIHIVEFTGYNYSLLNEMIKLHLHYFSSASLLDTMIKKVAIDDVDAMYWL